MIITKDGGLAWPMAFSLHQHTEVTTNNDFEEWISNAFPGFFPVVFESGRDAIKALGKLLRNRGITQLVVPPFTTQCVIEALTSSQLYVSTPYAEDIECDFIYHQYGHLFVQTSEAIVEDSVDTFMNSGISPFRTNTEFAIWSFRKLFGMQFGGMIWCRDKEVQTMLRSYSERMQTSSRDLSKCLKFVENNWVTKQEDLRYKLQLVLDIATQFESSHELLSYSRMLEDGHIPLVLTVTESFIEYMEEILDTNLIVIERHLVTSTKQPSEISLFLPLSQPLSKNY